MKKIYLLLSLSLAVLYAKEPKHILLLNSYHQGMTWVDNITQGAYDVLESDKNNFIVHIENMDSKRHKSTQYYKSLAQLYKNKYEDLNIELILSSDNNALDFLKQYKSFMFKKDIPVSFSGVNDFHPSLLNGYPNYTGVAENFSDKETVELILDLHPNTKEIYIINDYLTTGKIWTKAMKKNLQKFEKKVKITYAKNQTLQELQHTIKTLPKDTVLLMGVYFADKNNKYITFEKIGKELLDISSVPTYCLLNFNISDGVIGGSVISGYHQGAMMAKIGKSILQGIKPKDIKVVIHGTNRFIFNEKALNKFNINTHDLPKGSLITNKQNSDYEKYGLFVSLVLILFSIVFAIVIFIYYKKHSTHEQGVLKLLVYGPIIFIPTVISILIYSILTHNDTIFNENIKNLKIANIENQKTISKNEIEKLVNTLYKFKKDKKELLEYVNTIQYAKNGYLFAISTKGTLLAHGTRSDIIGDKLINSIDINNVPYVQKIIEYAMMNSLDFIEYEWENPSSKVVSTKYVYSKYLPEYDTIIATGFYETDIKALIEKKSIILKKQNDMQVEHILWISFLILIVSTILGFILSNIIKKIFEDYSQIIATKNKNLEQLNSSLEVKIQEELVKNREKDTLIFQQSKNASMGEMIGNIAHQWRQPLSVISTSATGMKVQKIYNLLDDNSIIKTCETINENAQYLSKTIDDFRNYIKNDRKKQVFQIRTNIDNLLSLLEGSIKNHNINLILDLQQNININGYPNELIQCMINIMNNAKDALKEIDDKRYIFITAKELNDDIIITFKDNAGGIDEEILDKIFDPYFTTKHKSQGTGLGLSMTYNMITEGMNGSIEVKNVFYKYDTTEYSGALFTIKLPLN